MLEPREDIQNQGKEQPTQKNQIEVLEIKPIINKILKLTGKVQQQSDEDRGRISKAEN